MKPNRTKPLAGIIFGASIFLLSPLLGLLLHSAAMQRAYETLGSPGINDPNRLSGNIDDVLFAAATGLFGALAGLAILIVSIIYYARAGRAFPDPNGRVES